jgi:hypothetical protein
MQTKLLCTCDIDNIMFVTCLGDDRLVVASPQEVIWCRVNGSYVENVRRSTHQGDSFSLFSLNDKSLSVLQLRHGPENFSLQLLDNDGLKTPPVRIPFSWINQVTTDSTGSLLAFCGSAILPGRAGWIAPIESCLIDIGSGSIKTLPFSAICIHMDSLYFVRERNLYKTKLASFQHLSHMNLDASPDATALVATDLPSPIITLTPTREYVQVVTSNGIYHASASRVVAVHKCESVIQAITYGNVCFMRSIGPKVYVYDAKRGVESYIISSSKSQVTGFDISSKSRENESEEGLLTIVSEKGVLDRFLWRT